jgi:hypothetical protein
VTVLHLGVVDIPYRHVGPGFRGRGKKRKRVASIGSKTTYEVAVILEGKYHVMLHFFEAHEGEVLQAILNDYMGAAESMLMGGPGKLGNRAGGAIQTMFNTFLDSGEIEHMGVPGVPTLAALHGVSHRFAHPYAKRPPRPSFIDTGLYETNFRAWVD